MSNAGVVYDEGDEEKEKTQQEAGPSKFEKSLAVAGGGNADGDGASMATSIFTRAKLARTTTSKAGSSCGNDPSGTSNTSPAGKKGSSGATPEASVKISENHKHAELIVNFVLDLKFGP